MKIKSFLAGNRKGVVFSVGTATTLRDLGARQMYPRRVSALVHQMHSSACMTVPLPFVGMPQAR